MRYKPPGIKGMGLQQWLDASKERHDDHGYDDFVEMRKKGINKSNIAYMFRVDRRSVTRWAELYDASLQN